MTRRLWHALASPALALLVLGAASLAEAASVNVVNGDAAGVGFNDATPPNLAAPGNTGQTVGEQKFQVVLWAAARFEQLLHSPVPINLEVFHNDNLFCDSNAATLAAAGPAWLLRLPAQVADHPQAPTWYPAALGHRLLGESVVDEDVRAQFNPDLGAADCLSGFAWYYGLDDAAPPGTLSFANTVLHELTHGMGFAALAGANGMVSSSDPDAVSPYFAYAFDTSSELYWWQMNAAERATSATNGLLVWAGPRTTAAAAGLGVSPLDADGHVYMYAPPSFSTGSSLSHFDSATSPQLLMEPFASTQVDVFSNDIDLGLEFLQDLGWREPGCGNGVPDAGEACDLGAGNDLNAAAPDECTTACQWFVVDDCPSDPAKNGPGVCGCGAPDVNTDGDVLLDCADGCPSDANKLSAGACGCGTSDNDQDSDGTPNCHDACAQDAQKVNPGICGCGQPDTDGDQDGVANCDDACPADGAKLAPGQCGCGVSDVDTDSDGTSNCNDVCAADPQKLVAGVCGCGVSDADSDADGVSNCLDECPQDNSKVQSGACGCGHSEQDQDADGWADCVDLCPADADKHALGACGCGVADRDSDGDGAFDCQDACAADAQKTEPGQCGCGMSDGDRDSDGTPDCDDGCVADPGKRAAGACGCGEPDTDTDSDGVADCDDRCPDDPSKLAAGVCGCGLTEQDSDSDGTLDCEDRCPQDAEKRAGGTCGCGAPDVDTDRDGREDCRDECPDDPEKVTFGDCGCGRADADADGDNLSDCLDACPEEWGAGTPSGCPLPNGEAISDAGVSDAAGSDAGAAHGSLPVSDDETGGAGEYPEGIERLEALLADGGYISPEEFAALVADGGVDPNELDQALIDRLIQQWAADGGLRIQVVPTLPDACECRAVGAERGGPIARGSRFWLLLGLLVALAARRAKRCC